MAEGKPALPDECALLLDEIRLNALRKINEILKRPATAKPIRHSGSILAAARTALDFTQAKPASVQTIQGPGGGPMHLTILAEIDRLVDDQS